ncbi:uncharacterized protein LOC112087270 [Eutrema salsugineum]|uniref:uncharacterized protein LOC112087270 n=1 Tax=Eutrema salsugineum TaxID=72664 RepID=UPI000CED02FF|nr:uncharacterized protein LOC112087270 [Eutrema salsugineum]
MITNILFDYGGHYSCTDDKWISREGSMYGIMFKTSGLEEISYSDLVGRICKKVGIGESSTKLKLNYIPVVVQTKKQWYILDDDDLGIYLTSFDNEGRRSVLYVEVINIDGVSEVAEQVSHVERVSLVVVNVKEVSAANDIASDGVFVGNAEFNDGAIVMYTGNGSTEQQHVPVMGNDEGVNLSRENEENGGDQDDISQTYRMLDIIDHPDCVEEQRIQREWADGLKLRVGAEFSCKQELIDLVYRGSHKHCFGITVHKSDKKRYYVKCGQAETGCNWYINAAKTAQSHIFTVRVYRKMHSCSRASACTSSKRRKGTTGLVAGVVSKTYPGRLKPPHPRDIMALVQTRGRVEVSYSTAWRGRQKAISYVRGTPEESFEHLHSYLYMIEQFNPGTTSSVEVDELGRFKYLFVALGPTIEGFAAMREVIIVDATFLKNGFGGCLVFATAQDPNHHHYPLSFGVVDGENNDNWNWFFTKLKTRIRDSSELVFVSDRNVSLINAIRDVYPQAKHGYCIYHLAQNVKKNVRREK